MSTKKVKAGISIGDINGIGLEVILKTLQDNRILDYCIPIVYGSVKIASFHRKAIGLHDFSFNIIQDSQDASLKRPNIINCWNEEVKIDLGQVTANGGTYAFKSLEAAVKDLQKGKIDLLLTAPINKENIQSDSFGFPGHTEYLQQVFGKDEVLMFMLSDEIRVGVVTGHIPLNKVAGSITSEKILAKLRIMHDSLKKDFWVPKPRIAVMGLNPHAGEQGLLGTEEKEIILPALEQARAEQIFAFGPYAADGFFGKAAYREFDAVLAMYHDQGLIPFKAVAFGAGANFTAGLPVARISPDHGTAYELAGKGVADESSFRKALFSGIDIVRRRTEYTELSANPLSVSSGDRI